MSWIEHVDEADASGELADIYAELVAARGKVSNILKVHSLRPMALRKHLELYMDLMFASGELSRRQRELIAVAVSQANRCAYCVAHHLEALARYERDPDRLQAIASDWRTAPLNPADRAMLEYATALTATPAAIDSSHLDRLRQQGHSDAAILLMALIVSYFNFVNRIALGLGVAHSEAEVQGYRA